MNKIEEIFKEFDDGCNTENISDPPSDKEWIKEFIAKTFSAGYKDGVKAGLMEARETLKKKEHIIDNDLYLDSGGGEMCYVCGKAGRELDEDCENDMNAYRTEALARLDEKINSLK